MPHHAAPLQAGHRAGRDGASWLGAGSGRCRRLAQSQDPTAAASVHRARSAAFSAVTAGAAARSAPAPLQAAATGGPCRRLRAGMETSMTHARGRVRGLLSCPCLCTGLHDRSQTGRGGSAGRAQSTPRCSSAPSAWTTASSARSLWLRHADNGAEKRHSPAPHHPWCRYVPPRFPDSARSSRVFRKLKVIDFTSSK